MLYILSFSILGVVCIYMHVQMVVWYILIESTLIYIIVLHFILLFSQNDFFYFWLIHSVLKNHIRLSIKNSFRGSSVFQVLSKKKKYYAQVSSRILTLSVIGLFSFRVFVSNLLKFIFFFYNNLLDLFLGKKYMSFILRYF